MMQCNNNNFYLCITQWIEIVHINETIAYGHYITLTILQNSRTVHVPLWLIQILYTGIPASVNALSSTGMLH